MKKTDLTSKYEHHFTLKNYSENTLRAYLNGLNIFLDYVKTNQISTVTPGLLDTYFHTLLLSRLACRRNFKSES